MKSKLLFILFYIGVTSGRAQQFDQVIEYTKMIGNTILSDPKGYIYLAGYDSDFANGNYATTGKTVYRIRKYDPVTAQPLWEKVFTDRKNLNIANVKMQGTNLVLAGTFSDTLCIDNTCHTSLGQNDIFLAFVDPAGNHSFQRQGATGDETVGGFDIDNAGNFYLAGTLTGLAQVGNLSYNAGNEEVFYLMKLDPVLNLVWRKIGKGDPSYGVSNGYGLRNYNSFLYFYANGNTKLEFSTDSFGCLGPCATIAEFDVNGNFIRQPSPFGSFYYHGAGIAFKDTSDNFYAVSWTNSKYGNDQLSLEKLSNQLTPAWGLDLATTFFECQATMFHGSNFYVGGRTQGTGSVSDYTILRGDLASGAIYEYYHIPLPAGAIGISGLHPYLNGNFIFSGQQTGDVTLGKHILKKGKVEDRDGFIAIMKPGTVGLAENNPGSVLHVYPNPCKDRIYLNTPRSGNLVLTDLLGHPLITEQVDAKDSFLDLSSFESGIYILKFVTPEHTSTNRIVISK